MSKRYISILRYLDEREGLVPIRDIEKQFESEPGELRDLLREMETKNWVKCENEHDHIQQGNIMFSLEKNVRYRITIDGVQHLKEVDSPKSSEQTAAKTFHAQTVQYNEGTNFGSQSSFDNSTNSPTTQTISSSDDKKIPKTSNIQVIYWVIGILVALTVLFTFLKPYLPLD